MPSPIPSRRPLLIGLGPADARIAPAASAGRAALPLVEVELAGHGRTGTSGKRHVDGLVSRRLRYESHETADDQLTVRLADPETDLRAAP
ncbi:hypothetical protein ABT009_09110 [Streptomyces sp. NPDC002896]|uniref:hypothetical protein n=1 Tax=Streptomyces sp. NPDC002896 TaxID=3154438 RepID=UPI0033322137